ncbi:3-isopropylmalate dehydratase large subunit [Aureimonas ureilytica]|uniref:3-isopropylmalate dehydratase large subunit n=1 Tax=Aureimonas ureilytica TaxID=401562 RepID=UPI00036AEA88|nr:3-isopropylmalate dehydratase large subunit [Aureimonas ureilytica]
MAEARQGPRPGGSGQASGPRSLLDKLWDAHVVAQREDGADLLWIDRHLLHEGSFHAFDKLAARNAPVSRPDLTFAVMDHYIPTRPDSPGAQDPAVTGVMRKLEGNATRTGIRLFGSGDPRQGIVHVMAPEQGLTLPGLTLVCGDSHTATHGALGALAFGIGASEVAHVLMTQTLWQRRPRRMRIEVRGRLAEGVTAKDLALSIIARIGADGAAGHAVEYAGEAVRALSIEGRLTLCNLSIEAGGRSGMVAPDETTIDFVRGRSFAPRGDAFERAAEIWLALGSDTDVAFDRDVTIDARAIAPSVTWGISPEDALPIDATVPDPARAKDEGHAAHIREALDYMGLTAGRPLEEIAIDRVFIGSCTNSRVEDLRAAAAILSGRKAKVPGLVSPGSTEVKRQCEAEGLDRIFVEAGLDWVGAGCSMCVGMNGDIVPPGERCASTTNRNFKGRQGPGARTHLMSPAMVAAAAVTGHLTDVRRFSRGDRS